MRALEWWRRRKDRKIVAWLRSPEGRAYLADHGGSDVGVGGAGSINTSVIAMIAQHIDGGEL